MFKKAIATTFQWGSKMALRLPKQAFIASGMLGLSLYLTSQKNSVYSVTPSHTPPAPSDKSETDQHQKLTWEVFSEENYQDAVAQGKNVIVFIEPSKFNDKFQNEIEQLMENVNVFQKMMGGRQIVFMKLEFGEKLLPSDLAKKYSVDIEEETLFLFKNKYLDLATYSFSQYFSDKNSVVKYFREVPQLNQSNQQNFLDSLSFLSSEVTLVIGYCPKSNQLYDKLEERLGALTLLQTYSENKNLHFLILNEEETANKIGLNNLNVGDLLFVSKKSKMGYGKKTHTMNGVEVNVTKFSNIKDKLNQIVLNASKTFNNTNIFVQRSFDIDVRFSLVLEIDENRIQKKDRKKLVELMGIWKKHLQEKEPDLLSKVQFILSKKSNESKAWQIYARNDAKHDTQIKLHSIKTMEQLKQLNLTPEDEQPHSYSYSFPTKTTTPDVESLTDWLKSVDLNTAKESFKSQTVPFYRKYSKKLVSKTFQEQVQKNEQDQAVFFYSKHCHACKQYGHYYENLALEHLRKNPFTSTNIIEFNRMNTDRNTLKTSSNFPYTPVFMIFKKQDKKSAYVYRSDKITPQLLRNFIEVTADFELVDPALIQKQVKSVKKVNLSSILS